MTENNTIFFVGTDMLVVHFADLPLCNDENLTCVLVFYLLNINISEAYYHLPKTAWNVINKDH